MKVSPEVAAAAADLVAQMEAQVPIDLLPPVSMPEHVANVLHTTVDALAQDRYRRRGVPWCKVGGRVRYLRTDVLKFLAANRFGGPDAA
ncbi:MAG: hypothetical protein QG597_5085 [Actinomycetota bacterium]|nr:hypothetical protein [Actinomycetota bacterium]